MNTIPISRDAVEQALLPCPFCGGLPKTTERPDNINGTEFFFAVACYCGGYSATAHKMAVRKTPEQAKRDAVDAWNTRAALAQADRPAVPQAQAGEPEAVAITDYNARGNIRWLFGPQIFDGTELITLQSHREALKAQRKAMEFEAWEYRERIVPALNDAIAKKDAQIEQLEGELDDRGPYINKLRDKIVKKNAALRACVGALKIAWAGYINLSADMETGPLKKQMRDHAKQLDAAITQAQEVLK